MQKNEQLKDRIALLMELTGCNQSQFAKMIDYSAAYVSELLSGEKTNLSIKAERNISERLGIDRGWLAEGIGDPPDIVMLPPPVQKANLMYLGTDGPSQTKIEVMTLAGAGNTHDEDDWEPIEEIYLPTDQVMIDGKVLTKAVKAEGDSMYPTIYSGGLVGVDFEDRKIVDNGIFLIRFPDVGLAIKRLQITTKGVTVVSDNKQVPIEDIPKSILKQNFVIGRVVWIFNKKV